MIRQNSGLLSILSVFLMALIIASCEKTSFDTKPALKFVNADSYDLSQGDYLSLNLRLTDKEGDISDTLWIRAFTRACSRPNPFPPFFYRIPEVPEKTNLDAEVNIRFIVGQIDPSAPPWNINLCIGIPDTTFFQFWMRDKAGNFSDTIEIDRPIIIRNN
jgi:hypothetical protein